MQEQTMTLEEAIAIVRAEYKTFKPRIKTLVNQRAQELLLEMYRIKLAHATRNHWINDARPGQRYKRNAEMAECYALAIQEMKEAEQRAIEAVQKMTGRNSNAKFLGSLPESNIKATDYEVAPN
jgi:hypothetical protein